MHQKNFSSGIKGIVCFAFMLIVGSAFSQQQFSTVDRATVQMQVTNEHSEAYYPKLLQRFNAFDTTLSNAEYRLLYYGFVFQSEYQGYNDMKEKEIREFINDKKYKRAIALCDSVLATIPISLSANYYRGLSMFLSDSTDLSYTKFRDRYYLLLDAIYSSGDGLTCETAFKTIFVSDEYEFMYNYLEIEDVGTQSLTGNCDLFEVSTSRYFEKERLYFDTSESLNALAKMFNSYSDKQGDQGTDKKNKKKKKKKE